MAFENIANKIILDHANVVVGQFHKTKGEKSKCLKIRIKILWTKVLFVEINKLTNIYIKTQIW